MRRVRVLCDGPGAKQLAVPSDAMQVKATWQVIDDYAMFSYDIRQNPRYEDVMKMSEMIAQGDKVLACVASVQSPAANTPHRGFRPFSSCAGAPLRGPTPRLACAV